MLDEWRSHTLAEIIDRGHEEIVYLQEQVRATARGGVGERA